MQVRLADEQRRELDRGMQVIMVEGEAAPRVVRLQHIRSTVSEVNPREGEKR